MIILQAFLVPPREDGKNACRCSDNMIHNKDGWLLMMILIFFRDLVLLLPLRGVQVREKFDLFPSFRITTNWVISIIKIKHASKIQAPFQKHFTSISFQGKRAFSRLLTGSFISTLLPVFNLPLKINTFLKNWYQHLQQFHIRLEPIGNLELQKKFRI